MARSKVRLVLYLKRRPAADPRCLLGLPVRDMLPTATAELLELQPLRSLLLVLGGYVIALFALRAL